LATKERYQNPAVGDTANLRLFTYNSNNLANLQSIETVEIYYLDPAFVSADNKDGRRLVESFDGSVVQTLDTGTYLLPVLLEDKKYVIGSYLDIWTVSVLGDQPVQKVRNIFQIFPALWYTTPIPVVYDFNFHFQPNKFRKGSKQFIIIEIVPNVPTAGELRQYYENLAIVADLRVSIEQTCGECMPAESDLRTVEENVLVDFREKRFGYYHLDTSELDCGIYDIWFQLEFGGNTYISDRMHFQVYN
jgi:hypothetical protein